MLITSGSPVFATENKSPSTTNDPIYGLSTESIDFLKEHNVALQQFSTSTSAFNNENIVAPLPNNEDMVQSLIRQTEANSFTDEQVQKYVEGALTTPTTVITPETTESANNIIPFAINRPTDNGIGYEVKSMNGYFQTTAFAKIPTVHLKTATNGYMFYTLSDVLDIGIWYGSGTAGEGWRCCWKYANHTMDTKEELLSGVTAGKEVYFNAEVINNDWVQLKVLDGNDFSKVYMDFSFSITGYGITKTNANWNRQITLCTTDSMSNGSYLLNGEFSQAYIYKTNGTYSQTNSSNTLSNHCGVFGTNDITAKKVTVNNSLKWYMENISIRFN